jgi:hypothetical protein
MTLCASGSAGGPESAAFYQSLKSKVGLAAAKAAALRININIEGCGVVAPPMHAPSRSTCPPLSLSPHSNSFVIGPAVINHKKRDSASYASPRHTGERVGFEFERVKGGWVGEGWARGGLITSFNRYNLHI